VFLPDGDILTGDSEGNILTWGRSLSDSRTPGRGGAKGMWFRLSSGVSFRTSVETEERISHLSTLVVSGGQHGEGERAGTLDLLYLRVKAHFC
jgi:hypothetical protein